MPEGGRLTLATANVSLDADAARDQIGVTPGDFVMIVVSDSGTGMSDEVKAHIFEPFYTTKEHGKGTGLGLATCYGIVKHAGGHIVVDSKPGLGTSFSVFLPQSGETEQPARRPRSRIPTHGIETILIVEDVPALCLLTERMLLQHGYHVLSARSGEEALRLVERHAGPLHLLLTDIVLGNGLNGIKLAERVRFLRPETRVLFTSGYTSDVISLYDLLEQGHAFIPKPFSTEALGRKVREVLDAT
jgi:CheY-like chemotaxis protein